MSKAENVAGALIAPMFIRGGWDATLNPESKVKVAEPLTNLLSSKLSFVPDDPTVLIRVNGAVQVGAGALLAMGPLRRLAALVLAGSVIPSTYAGRSFWKEVDEDKKSEQQIHFLKNAAMLGGLASVRRTRAFAAGCDDPIDRSSSVRRCSLTARSSSPRCHAGWPRPAARGPARSDRRIDGRTLPWPS